MGGRRGGWAAKAGGGGVGRLVGVADHGAEHGSGGQGVGLGPGGGGGRGRGRRRSSMATKTNTPEVTLAMSSECRGRRHASIAMRMEVRPVERMLA